MVFGKQLLSHFDNETFLMPNIFIHKIDKTSSEVLGSDTQRNLEL
jgi:hypothetical protein